MTLSKIDSGGVQNTLYPEERSILISKDGVMLWGRKIVFLSSPGWTNNQNYIRQINRGKKSSFLIHTGNSHKHEISKTEGKMRRTCHSGLGRGKKRSRTSIYKEMKRVLLGHSERIGHRQDFDQMALSRFLPACHTGFILHYRCL